MSDMSNGQSRCPLSVIVDKAGQRSPAPRAGRMRHDVRNAARTAVRSMTLISDDAQSRLDASQADLLAWSAALACDRRLTRKQGLRLHEYLGEMCPRAVCWTQVYASVLLDEMPAGESGMPDIPSASGHTPLRVQRLHLAQVQLYLSGTLVRRLECDQWRSRIRQHVALGSIAERITAVQVDCAWESMDASLHYDMLCRHLQTLELGERDPVQRQMLNCNRALLVQCLQLVGERTSRAAATPVGELAGAADDARRRLVLKILLTGLLDARLFSGNARWRMDLVQRLHDAGGCSRRVMNMDDMSLIAFLREADDARLSGRVHAVK